MTSKITQAPINQDDKPSYPPTKSVVQLDNDGLFIGMTQADLSPLQADEGVYLLPHNAIDVTPPKTKDNKAAKWQDGEWHYITDLRGKIAYNTENGKEVVINTVGELDNSLTLLTPMPHSTWNGRAWVITPEKQAELKAIAQNEMWERIKEKRHNNTRGGVYVKSVDKWFHTDDPSRTQYLALQLLPQLPEVMWKTMDNSFIKLDKDLLIEIAMAILKDEQNDFANAERHRIAMLQADETLSYDYSSGWSATFDSQAPKE